MKHGALPVVIGGAVVATAVCAHVGLTPALILGLGTGLTLYAIGRTDQGPGSPDRQR